MKLIAIIIFFLLLVVSHGCGANVSDDFMITLSRKECNGKCVECRGDCPAYDLTIDANGTVVFDGKQRTKTIGKATGKISAAEIEKLVKEFEKIRYFDLLAVYKPGLCPAYLTDFATVETSIRQNGKTKSISHYQGCYNKNPSDGPYPAGLTELENIIDQIAGTQKWVYGGG